MCLSTVYKKTPRRTGKGYKVFIPASKGKVESSCRRGYLKTHLWLKAGDPPLVMASDRNLYEAGFHIFLDFESARVYQKRWPNEVIRRVEYRKAIVKGTGMDWDCHFRPQVVAAEIRILGVVPKRKAR